jgi:putative molybdenum carrier protein
MHPVLKIVSGGQTGVDRAALDAALACSLRIGGWCPAGRRAEDGLIPTRYPLVETPSPKYPQRTAWNVRDSDATLILTLGELDSGSRLTAEVAQRLGKPCIIATLDSYPRLIELPERLPFGAAELVLNVAGPRESRCPGIYARAFGFLATLYRGFDVTKRYKVAQPSRARSAQPVTGVRIPPAQVGSPPRH